ncbi:MAG: HAD family phosphatase [Rhodobacteraceae bacterium]|nr:MAG: HAD family phosphatase [Paracoccaceae bacterium]
MDGLLLDTERVCSEAFVEVTDAYGVAADRAEAFFLTLVGTSSLVTRKGIIEFIDGVDIDRFVHDWHDVMHRLMAGGVPVKPTVAETIGRMAQDGHRMAVVTSTGGARARDHLGEAGLLAHFSLVVGGDEVTANKPDPAPYLHAADRLGVDPARSVAFEDSDRGVASATAAGCTVVQIPDLRPPGQPFPALGQRSAEELRGAVFGLGLMA